MLNSIKPLNGHVNDIHLIKYNVGSVKYKFTHNVQENYKDFVINQSVILTEKQQLYTEELTVSATLKKHLMFLLQYIPEEDQAFYANIRVS